MIARKRKTPRREDEGEEEEEMDDDLEKRRRGARDVWDVIVKCDDICFTHILPRLNRTDVKFLYGVNTETRKLVKRSSRKGDLKKRFEVRRDVVDIDFGVCVGESIVVAELLDETIFLL